MALKKLPCEYKEIRSKRWERCFGDLSIKDQLELMKVISKICNICEV